MADVYKEQLDDAYQDYVEQRHAQFNTPEAVLCAMVRRATGQTLERRRKLVRGMNEAYLVDTGADEFFVKIRREGGSDVASEAWAVAQARGAGVRAPEVLLVGTEEHGGERLEFMVQRAAVGRSLTEVLPELSEEARATVWRNAGAELAKLHTVAVGGFCQRSRDGQWDFPDWRAVMASVRHDRGSEKELLLQAGFTGSEFAEMMRLIEVYRDQFDCPQPALCHGDYLSEHILVDEALRVTAVIDFGDFQGGHPVHDFAIMSHEGETGIGQMAEGYSDKTMFADRFQERLHLHRLTLELGYLAYFTQMEDFPEEALNTRGVRKTLEWLRGQGL